MTENGFEPLFNGRDLTGWFVTPRSYGEMWPGGPTVAEAYPDLLPADYEELAAEHAAVWTVEDGAIVGRQDSPGSGWGGYLVSERKFADFELVLEAKPDWPADTGIMLRKQASTFHGIQVLLDHRKSGAIAGFYGNGIGGFQAIPFALDAVYDDSGNPIGLQEEDPKYSIEPFTDAKRQLLSYAASIEEFLAAWRWADWNEFRIRVVGAKPVVTSWVNGTKIAEIDLATIEAPNYNADAVASLLGREGHIAFEVHDNDAILGSGRWGQNAACRWRNVRVKEL